MYCLKQKEANEEERNRKAKKGRLSFVTEFSDIVLQDRPDSEDYLAVCNVKIKSNIKKNIVQ